MPTVPYSSVADLLIGDTQFDEGQKNRHLAEAADEINARLGQVYTLPLSPVPPATILAEHIRLMLKNCNNLIASGRLIMSANNNGMTDGVDAYGEYLLKEGRSILDAMVNGMIVIGAVKIPTQGEGNAPEIYNTDSRSGVDAFYDFVGDSPFYPSPIIPWRPGA